MAGGSLRAVRWVLVGAAVVLLAVVAGFVGYARHRANAYLRGLPGRLGVHVTQESDNVTYSQSVKGRTIYTVHAAKQIQREGGRYTLRDVGIVMYGAKGDRADRISGQEFEWDQKAGVVRAVGEVFLDLAAPGYAGDEAKTVHVKTSGLVFREKEKAAATEELVEFRVGQMSGRAVGASYDSESGVVVLRAGVRMSGVRGGRPTVLTAGRAELDRVGLVVRLDEAKVVSSRVEGEQTGSAARAVVRLTAEGKPERVEADGQVVLMGDERGGARGMASGQRMEVDLNGAGQVRAGRLVGGVRFSEDAAGGAKRTVGQGAEARVGFDGEGRARSAVLTGGAEVEERAGQSERRLAAEKVEMTLGGGGKAPVVVTGARASGTGGARLRLVDAGGKGRTETGVRAEVLTARFAAGSGAKRGTELAGLDGAGKTLVEQTLADAAGVLASRETSAGETLRMDFRPGLEGPSELVRAEQRGGVTVVREARRKVGAPDGAARDMEVEHARGDVAVYEKDADRLTMTGGVELQDAESALFAEEVVTNRSSGESTARGGVRVSYSQGGAGEPVHVVASRAVSHKATGVTEFFAEAGGRTKMWQGGSQVEAPELRFDRGTRTVVARDAGGAEGAVRAVLASGDPPGVRGGAAHVAEAKPSDKPRASNGAPPFAAGPVRVWSREMVYRDAAREVEFTGGVRVQDQEGTTRASGATVYLAQAGAAGDAAGPSHMAGAGQGASRDGGVMLGGKVERMVGAGGVVIEQPGRRATGDRLVYTAADGMFVLTGTKALPPRVVDEARGTTTGGTLRFRSGEDRVEVSGGEDAEARRVRSETKVKR